MFGGIDAQTQPLFVNPSLVPAWAERVRPHLGKIAEGSRGRYLAADILTALAAGRMQLWVALEGAELLCVMLTEVRDYPRARAMRLIGLVGHRPSVWAHLLTAIETAARVNFGCTIMEAMHPPKYRSILPGYVCSHQLSEKVI